MPHPAEVTVHFTHQAMPRVSFASPSIEGLLGYTAEQFLNGAVKWPDLIHADDQDVLTHLLSPTLSPATGFFNIRIRHLNGQIRCVRGDYALETHSQIRGQTLCPPEPMLSLQLIDARHLHQRSAQLLTPSFVAMMENADDFIFFKDRNHVLTGASQSLVDITLPTQHWTDLTGQTDYDLFPEAYADLYYRLEKQIFAGHPQPTVVRDAAVRTVRHTGNSGRLYGAHSPRRP